MFYNSNNAFLFIYIYKMDKLPTELILQILLKSDFVDIMNMCEINKKMINLCRNNIKVLSKLFLKIPKEDEKYWNITGKFYKDVPNVDYYNILQFYSRNNLIKNNRLVNVTEDVIGQLTSPMNKDVVKFLHENDVFNIYSYNWINIMTLKNNNLFDKTAYEYLIKAGSKPLYEPGMNYELTRYFVNVLKINPTIKDIITILYTRYPKHKEDEKIRILKYLNKKFKINITDYMTKNYPKVWEKYKYIFVKSDK